MTTDPAVAASILARQNRQTVDILGRSHVNGVSVGRLWIIAIAPLTMPEGVAVTVDSLVTALSVVEAVASDGPFVAGDDSSNGRRSPETQELDGAFGLSGF